MTIAFGSSLSKTHLDAASDDPAQARAELEAIIDRLNTKLATVTLIQSSDLSNGGISGTVAETTGGGFPNVDADVTATDSQMNAVLTPYETATVSLGGDFDAGMQVKCERIGNTVTISALSNLEHSSSSLPESSSGAIPSAFRPTFSDGSVDEADNICSFAPDRVVRVTINNDGTFKLAYRDWSGSSILLSDSTIVPSITFLRV